MNKIKTIYLSYWFKELEENPAKKVYELEDEIKSIFNAPLMFNEDDNRSNLILPRIQAISSDKKYLFSVSYINAILSINVDDISLDEAILLINNNIQLFYDIIKRVFDVKIVYSSIKVEMVNENKKVKKELIDKLNLNNKDYENLSFKEGYIKDDYYINYILEYSTEYNFNFNEQVSEDDLFNKSMVTSLKEAELNKEYLFVVVEVNDRYSYNKDPNHESTKDDLRGMIIEIKEILCKELFWEI